MLAKMRHPECLDISPLSPAEQLERERELMRVIKELEAPTRTALKKRPRRAVLSACSRSRSMVN